MLCDATLKASNHKCTCVHISATEPSEYFLQSPTLDKIWPLQRDLDPEPLSVRMPVWSLSRSFVFFVFFCLEIKNTFCCFHPFRPLSRTAHSLPPPPTLR
ncbi:hypothetical protein AMECASPLE_000781 [Ameca splendens]|uniref:Uncharacterized protein n=1 Tax=Ameca splendens TaxID=208324 RepID=A0ABV0XLW2_9TELE